MLGTSITAVWQRSTDCITRWPGVDAYGDSQPERWVWHLRENAAYADPTVMLNGIC
jgi:hypothetical protein